VAGSTLPVGTVRHCGIDLSVSQVYTARPNDQVDHFAEFYAQIDYFAMILSGLKLRPGSLSAQRWNWLV
jgi:hypothetical protein